MSLYRLKRGVHYHRGQRIAANSKTGGNVVDLPDDHPSLREVDRWERVGADQSARQAGGAPQFLPASGSAQDAATAAAATAPAHNASEVLTSETVRGGAIPGVTEPLVGGSSDAESDTRREGSGALHGKPLDENGAIQLAGNDLTASPERDAVANSSLSSPTRDWYTYTIPQAVHHVRAASDLTTLAQYKNLELAPKVGKQRGKVLEAIDERAQELKRETEK